MYMGAMPGMKSGDIVGHEFMGVVEAVGPEVKDVEEGKSACCPFLERVDVSGLEICLCRPLAMEVLLKVGMMLYFVHRRPCCCCVRHCMWPVLSLSLAKLFWMRFHQSILRDGEVV